MIRLPSAAAAVLLPLALVVSSMPTAAQRPSPPVSGGPGSGYCQNRADYAIRARLDTASDVDRTNNSWNRKP